MQSEEIEGFSEISIANKEILEANRFTQSGYPIYVFAELEFVKILHGKFLMGSKNNDKDADDNEKPQHYVNIPYDYLITRFPITNKQYSRLRPVDIPIEENLHPYMGSCGEAWGFVAWLNRNYQSELPRGYAYELPTEAEWEKAARGTHGRIYPWGNKFSINKCNTIGDKEKGAITSVDAYSPQGDSPYGVADMVGNIAEWTRSLYRPYPYDSRDGRELSRQPDEVMLVFRGVAYVRTQEIARVAHRFWSSVHRFDWEEGGIRVVVIPRDHKKNP